MTAPRGLALSYKYRRVITLLYCVRALISVLGLNLLTSAVAVRKCWVGKD